MFSAVYSSLSSSKPLALVDELAVFGLELVGNVFQEDQTQHDGLVFRRVDIAAHLVRRAPDLRFSKPISAVFMVAIGVWEKNISSKDSGFSGKIVQFSIQNGAAAGVTA